MSCRTKIFNSIGPTRSSFYSLIIITNKLVLINPFSWNGSLFLFFKKISFSTALLTTLYSTIFSGIFGAGHKEILTNQSCYYKFDYLFFQFWEIHLCIYNYIHNNILKVLFLIRISFYLFHQSYTLFIFFSPIRVYSFAPFNTIFTINKLLIIFLSFNPQFDFPYLNLFNNCITQSFI